LIVFNAHDEITYWQAVQEHDRQFDGVFVYAVRSTGIYCRPSCPSRRPTRENVSFFALPEAAERAGYRACKRCNPRDVDTADPQAELVRRICRSIETSPDMPTLDELSAEFHVSPYHLQRTFKRIMGITPRQYAEHCRVNQFKAQLRNGDSVTSALYDAGYGSSSRLYEHADANLGMTPSVYQKGGSGMEIGYKIVDCSLGRLLVAATARGVCAVSLGDDDAPLVNALHDEYPSAEIVPGGESFSAWVQAILDYLGGWQPHLDLPLDLQATAFQRRVWQELQAIPYGETRSYSQVAAAIGQQTAVRAVAHACASNPVSLVIPCHRVVRQDGSLGGYRWGIGRKQTLLAHEQTEQSIKVASESD
jgi:AraC family transcriptional regulator of adaptative response/methylated-DNA-[protein]-cysteine methyltransferase